jgi:hypothetical protein
VALHPGQTLQHYRLVEKIGEGGMGEVWRAIDGTLDREVAIKILPATVADDRDRIARFEREAKLLASLNHPNIAAIYGFAEAEGVRFLAMELVRGEDLAHVLARGPMPVREALDAARQVAAAFEAAHDSGVVHRDLKPANVLRTPDGQIKVLDFGLAKSLGNSGASPVQSATVTSTGNTTGMILGTASYMSPEQARGLPVDRRTDLWAFGCVLYEMLSGRRAFDGATVTDVLAAVVAGEPDWDKLPAATPPAVRRLLRRCLEKDARKRLRDAGDASLLLEDNPEDARTAAVPAPRPSRTGALVGVGLAVAIASALAGWAIAHRGGRGTTEAPVTFQRVTFGRGLVRSARFAPDGKTIVYGAAWSGPPVKLYLARTDSPEEAPISLPPAELLSVSKSGEMLVSLGHAYYGWMGDGTLARASLLGGAPREMLEHVRVADWSPDGTQLAVVRWIGGLDQLEYPVGTVLDKTAGYFGDVRVSPDGERVAYSDHGQWGDNRGSVAVVDRSGKKTTLGGPFGAIQGVVWGAGGKEVWYTVIGDNSGSELRAADLSGRTRVLHSSIVAIEIFDVAPDGRVLLGREESQREVVALLDGFPEPRQILIPGEASLARGVTNDGKAILIANHAPADYETWLIRSDRPGAVRLGGGDAVSISPDGAFAMTADADNRKVFVTPTGMGPTRETPNPDGIRYESLASWLPDGKHAVVAGRKGSDPARGYLIDLATGKSKPFGAPGMMWLLYTGPPVSPDGRYAVLQDATGVQKRWPIDGGDPLPIQGLKPDDRVLCYTQDGRAIFVAGRSLPIVIERVELDTGRRVAWATVSPTDPAGLRYTMATISPNGRYWALSTAKLLTDLYVVDGLK